MKIYFCELLDGFIQWVNEVQLCPKVLWWISNYYQSNYNQNKTEVTEQQESCFLRVRKVRKTFGINFEGIEENWTRSKEKTKQIASSILHVQFTFLEGNLIDILRRKVCLQWKISLFKIQCCFYFTITNWY